MFTDLELMNLHVRALFTHDAQSRLLRVNEPGGGGLASRFFLGRTKEGNLWRFRADVTATLVQDLEMLYRDEPIARDLQNQPRHFETYLKLLESHESVQKVWQGPAYHFTNLVEPSRPVTAITETSAELLGEGFSELIPELPTWQPFVAVVENGRAVSICRSVRITLEAHEAGVETLSDFRGKGYAKDVVAGWARLVRSMGAVPLYDTSWENTASQAVARKLQLVMYGADFHIT
jgi:RimJ/RimL family protein N-acetyltransferase